MKVYVSYFLYEDSITHRETRPIDNSLIRYNDDRDIFVSVFGFTTKKKLFSMFTYIHRGPSFINKKLEMTEDEYNEFRSTYLTAEIQKRNLCCGYEKEIQIPMSKCEYVYSVYEDDETVREYLLSVVDINPSLFKKRIQFILSCIGYSLEYYYAVGDSVAYELEDYNSSFYPLPNRKPNQLSLFCMIYKDFIDIDHLKTYVEGCESS